MAWIALYMNNVGMVGMIARYIQLVSVRNKLSKEKHNEEKGHIIK